MALRLYLITKDGNRNEGVFYYHEQAFTKAIFLESLFDIPIIEERQWHADTNSLVTKTYHAHNKAIYVKDDPVNPIYSFLPTHTSMMFYRKVVYAMCKKAIKIYGYYGLQCPYIDEYLYGFTLLQLKELEDTIKADVNVVKFGTDVEYIAKGILDTTKVLNIIIPDFIHKIMALDASELMLYVKTVEKSLKNHILKNVYGMSYIENF